MGEAIEYFLVETFVSEFPIEAFDEAVLLRLARRDVMLGDTCLVLPFQDSTTGEPRAVVRHDGLRLAIEADAAIQLAGDTST